MTNTRLAFQEHPRLWGIMAVAGLRGMASVAFLPFLALYLGLDDELGLGNAALGLHIALLVGVGVVATPVVGYISDRLGRKLVLIPEMIALCALSALLVPFGDGIGLIVILALMGLFFFSDQPILTAAALDTVGQGVAASALGVFSFSRFALGAASPIIAGELFDSIGIESTFFYISGIYLIATLVLVVVPLSVKQPQSETSA